MIGPIHFFSKAFLLAVLLLPTVNSPGQASPKKTDSGTNILWEDVDISHQDLFLGPGGDERKPDLSSITFVGNGKKGYSRKYIVKDAAGNTWVAKVGLEAQTETAAVRILSALGYKTEVNYLVPTLTIPGKGTFSNVRLEARPDDVERGKAWKWGRTPFERTKQMQGLMLMMAFINNWDMKSSNNVILKKGDRREYAISDLGATFGRTGRNGMPLFWRIGRSRNNPGDYAHSTFIKGVKRDRVKVAFNGKNRSRMKNFSTADARWLADLLTQLSESQIRDAFRAANYSDSDIDLLARAVMSRIDQLDQVGSNSGFAGRK
jgi:hypothetical protein